MKYIVVLPDGVADLPVQEPPVGHHYYRIEYRIAILLKTNQLVPKPGD